MMGVPMAKKFKYTPVIRWKQYDRIGLSAVCAAARDGVQPLILIWSDQYADQKPSTAKKPPKTPTLTAAETFASQVKDAWGATPFFVDAADLPGTPSKHALDDIRAAASALGLQLVPATRLGYAQPYQQAVARAVAGDKGGVALRVSLAEMGNAAAWAKNWVHPVKQTDLIVDLAGSVADVAALGVAATDSFKKLHNGTSWRSVTMAGGGIPQFLSQSEFSVGATSFPRHELAFFNSLIKAGLPYAINYGDYGSISPAAPADVGGATPINAKYTLPGEFMIFKGVKIIGPGAKPMADQLRSYATTIVGLGSTRARLSCCDADDKIDAIAAGGPKTGNPGVWVGLNLNRHIEVTRHNLP